jgi:hypothetical protein
VNTGEGLGDGVTDGDGRAGEGTASSGKAITNDLTARTVVMAALSSSLRSTGSPSSSISSPEPSSSSWTPRRKICSIVWMCLTASGLSAVTGVVDEGGKAGLD